MNCKILYFNIYYVMFYFHVLERGERNVREVRNFFKPINFINVLQIVLKNVKNDGNVLYREGIVVSRINYSKIKQNFNIQYVLIYYTLELRNLTANGKEISTYVLYSEKRNCAVSVPISTIIQIYILYSHDRSTYFPATE